tara:strand:- start:78 stop:797 length:720 start_codon:yes stop_codon:yes gene_type:complete
MDIETKIIYQINEKDKKHLQYILENADKNDLFKNNGRENFKSLKLQLGLSIRAGKCLSKETYENLILFKHLTKFFTEKLPDKHFSSIEINLMKSGLHNMNMHVDTKNVGPAYVISIGSFTGGNMYTLDGSVNSNNKIVEFDACLPHMPGKFEGKRFSIVFYTQYSKHTIWKPGAKRSLQHIEKKYKIKLPYKPLVRCNYLDKYKRFPIFKRFIKKNKYNTKKLIEQKAIKKTLEEIYSN